MWGIIDGFGNIDVLAELDGANMHRLSNGLTLDGSIHTAFDGLNLWFEEVQVSNIKRFSFSLDAISRRVLQILIPSVPPKI